MPSTIKIKRSNVAGKIPTTSDIASGELALNIKDQKLYSSNGTGVFQIGGAGGTNAVVTKTAIKDLTSNSLVVTNVFGVFVTAMSDYLQVANAAATYLTKNNPVITGTLTANGSTGTDGYYLRTSGTGIYWSPASSGSSGATWSALTTTNTALRTLISDRLQVANATTLFNNRLTVANSKTYLQVANAATLYATKISPTTSGVLAHTGRATISTNLSVTGNTIISGLSANGSLGTANYVLKTNGTTTFWGVPKTVTVNTATSTATLTWNSDTYDQYQLTAMAAGVTVSADSGTPSNGQKIVFRFKDNGTARSISLTTGTSKSFRAIGTTLPTTTVISKTLYVGAIYNSADDRWDVVATAQEA